MGIEVKYTCCCAKVISGNYFSVALYLHPAVFCSSVAHHLQRVNYKDTQEYLSWAACLAIYSFKSQEELE
jgi:hypothetical protein